MYLIYIKVLQLIHFYEHLMLYNVNRKEFRKAYRFAQSMDDPSDHSIFERLIYHRTVQSVSSLKTVIGNFRCYSEINEIGMSLSVIECCYAPFNTRKKTKDQDFCLAVMTKNSFNELQFHDIYF